MSLPGDEIIDIMKLKTITTRPWSLQACSAKTGENIKEGMEWLVDVISKRTEGK